MRHAYYIERKNKKAAFLITERFPMSFKHAVVFAIMNNVNIAYSLWAVKTEIEAEKVQSNKLFELDGKHDMMDEVKFIKDSYNKTNYMVFKNQYSALWKIPDFIKDLYQRNIIHDVKCYEEGITILATCKNKNIKSFDFTRNQQWWNMQFEQQVCESFEQYNEIHMWIIDTMMQRK